jgi:hypothetical protein
MLKGITLGLLLLMAPQNTILPGTTNLPGTTTISPSGSSPVTYASNGCGVQNTGGTTISCTPSSAVSTGQTIFVNLTEYTASCTPTLTDSNSGTITNVLGGSTGTSYSGQYDWVWQITSAGSGSHILTATTACTMSYPSIIANVWTGGSVDNANALGLIIYSSGYTACGNVTTSSPNESILSFLNMNGGGTATPASTPQTMTMASSSASNNTSAYGVAATAGPNYVQWTSTGSYPSICDTLAVH